MKKRIIQLGDIYASKLSDGRYGTVKVVNIIDNSYLIYTSKYINSNLPTLDNKEIHELLFQNRFLYQNEPDLRWVDGKINKDLIYIGNVPLSESERDLESAAYGGKWDQSEAESVYFEWRWIHDRQNFESEIHEREIRESVEFLNLPQKPKKMMNDDIFWSIISLLNIDKDTEDEEIITPVIEVLAKTSVNDIKQFEENIAYKLYLLDTKGHAKNIGENSYTNNDSNFSPDLFLYIRCFVIAKGQDFYELVLNNPQKMPRDIYFEQLLNLASEAYTKRMGKEFEYIPGCDYETFSNADGWK